MIDIRRRGFLFGAAATLVLPPVRTIYIPARSVGPYGSPRIITLSEVTPGEFLIPRPQALAMLQKLLDGQYVPTDVPRWAWVSPRQYEALTGQKAKEVSDA